MPVENYSSKLSCILLSGFAAVLCWLSSGCRIGSSKTVLPPNPDQISGYYVIQPQSLTFYANTLDSETHSTSPPQNSILNHSQKSAPVSAPISMIPEEIGQIFTNPVALVMEDLSAGTGRWFSPISRTSLPIRVHSDLTLSLRGSTRPVVLWKDPECTTHLEIYETGKLTRSQEVQAIPGNTLPLSGSAQLTIQVANLLEGNCIPTLKDLVSCLQDVTQCGGSSNSQNVGIQSQILELFNPWLKAEALTVPEIANLANFAYEVVYDGSIP